MNKYNKKEKNILVITTWTFEDALIQTYTLPYLKIIRDKIGPNGIIYLATLESKDTLFSIEGAEIKKELLEKFGIKLIPFKYYNFGVRSLFVYINLFLRLTFLSYLKKITHIHTWCTTAGMWGYMISLITRKPLILDSYEPHAEPMTESGTWNKNGLAFRILFYFERRQLYRAKHVILCVEKMKEYIQEKFNFDLKQFYVKPACVNLDNFHLSKSKNQHLLTEFKLTNNRILVYAGKFGGSYLEDDFFCFCKEALRFWGDEFKLLLLSGHSKNEIEQYCKKTSFPQEKIIHLFVAPHDVPSYIGLADMAITPFKPVPSKRYGTPIKTGEYWAMGLPVFITPNISDDSQIIEHENIGAIIKTLTPQGYKEAIQKMEDVLKKNTGNQLQNKIRNIAVKYRNFEIAEKIYSDIYN